MAAPSLDNEFMQLWSKLTVVQKQSLLSVIKSFAQPEDRISIEQYNQEIEEAMKRMDSGEHYTHEQVMAMSKGWVNDK